MVDLKTLSEMPSVKEMMQKLKKPHYVSTTKVSVGPLNNEDAPEGMLDNANTKEAIKRQDKLTPEEISEIIAESPGTVTIKESNPMTRREELETKGVSQLMAERFAKGVPRGAYSECSFEKGGEPFSPHASRKEFSGSTPEEAAIKAYQDKKRAETADVYATRKYAIDNGLTWDKEFPITEHPGDPIGSSTDPNKPMNRIGADKPRKEVITDSYRYYLDDGDVDVTENNVKANPGVTERAKDALALVPAEARQHKKEYTPEQREALRQSAEKYGLIVPDESLDAWLDFLTDKENFDPINLMAGKGLQPRSTY